MGADALALSTTSVATSACNSAPAERPAAAGADARRLAVAIVSHFAYGALSGAAGGRLVGGVEWQTSMLARWLAANGHRVSLLTWDEGQPDDCVIDGVRVIKICRRDAGIPGVRFFAPRWSGLNRALRIADADVYYHNCGEYVTGQVAMWCRRHARGFVYSVASDPDCDARLPEMKTLRERWLYRYGIRHADSIIVQTENQQRMLRGGFGLASDVIPMPCLGPGPDVSIAREAPGPSPRVLWVARIVPLKRLEWLLDIAEAMPRIQFAVVGPPDPETDYTRSVEQRARALPNVTLHGRVDRGRMPEFYRNASLLICTSVFEGFPNTFLEAFSQATPVVSTVDPDGVIRRFGLGGVAGTVSELIASISSLLEGADKWTRTSSSARRYYLDHHHPDRVMPRFATTLAQVAGRYAAVRPRRA